MSDCGSLGEDRRKIVVLDTNVPENNPAAPESSFDDNFVIIPEVLTDELDSLKQKPDKAYNARAALRVLERLSESGDLRKGIAVANGGMLYLYPRIDSRDFFGMERNPDNEIIATALLLQRAYRERTVMVVSDDTNFLIRARQYGLIAERYLPKKPFNTNTLFQEKEVVLDERLYQVLNERGRVALSADYLPNHVYPVRTDLLSDFSEECFVGRDGRTLRRISPDKLALLGVGSGEFRQKAACDVLFDQVISPVFFLGKAGTCKTIFSLAAAIQQVYDGIYERIIVIRPPVPVSGKDKTGFVPGKLEEKMDPWMQPIYDNLSYLFEANGTRPPFREIVKKFGRNDEKIQEAALSEFYISMASFDHLQGRTFAHAFVIVDEAQNMPLEHLKMVGSRVGGNSKVVFNGDISQLAVGPFSGRASSGLSFAAAHFLGDPDASVITLKKVERSKQAEKFANIGRCSDAPKISWED